MSTSDIVVQDHERPPERGSNRRPRPGDDNPNPRAPKFGCILVGLLGAFFIGIAINVVLSGLRHYDNLANFTQPAALELPEDRGTEAELLTIRERVELFRKTALAGKDPAELSLSAKDLNILIANDAYLADVRETVFFEKIDDDGLIHAQISRPMAKVLPWKPRRYLNGKMTLKIEAAPGQVFLRVVDIEVPNGNFDAKILAAWQTQDELDPYKNDEDFEDVIKTIQSATHGEGQITFSTAHPEIEDGK